VPQERRTEGTGTTGALPGSGPRVKICGIRSGADLRVAVASGADAVGFISGVTHLSEDALTPEQAAELVAATPPYVSTVQPEDSRVARGAAGTGDSFRRASSRERRLGRAGRAPLRGGREFGSRGPAR